MLNQRLQLTWYNKDKALIPIINIQIRNGIFLFMT